MIPYTDDSAHVEDDFCTERRLRETIAFIRRGDIRGMVLDVGLPNYVGREIKKHFNVAIFNTGYGIDFNRWWPDGTSKWNTVLCLEVFEHLMNPALFLERLSLQMEPGGILYLSTPVHNRFGFMFNETCHFAEYRVEAVKTCLEYAGFRVTDTHLFKSIPFWQGMKHGGGLFRTALRVSSQYTQIHRAIKT